LPALGLRLRGRGGADNAQVAAAADLHALADRLSGRSPLSRVRLPRVLLPHRALPGRPYRPYRAALGGGCPLGAANVADDVRQRLKVVGALLRWVWREPDHVPATRHDEPRGVHLAEVPRVRIDIDRERPEYGCRVFVHVRERVDGRLLARGT
jgi:hypothetical protein